MQSNTSSSRAVRVSSLHKKTDSDPRGNDHRTARDLATVTEGGEYHMKCGTDKKWRGSVGEPVMFQPSDLSRSSLSKQDRNWIRYQREVCVAGWVSFILLSVFIYGLARLMFVALGAL